MTKNEEVKIIMVKHYRIGLDEKYEVTKKWSLNDLQMIDGKEADTVSSCFVRGPWNRHAGDLGGQHPASHIFDVYWVSR